MILSIWCTVFVSDLDGCLCLGLRKLSSMVLLKRCSVPLTWVYFLSSRPIIYKFDLIVFSQSSFIFHSWNFFLLLKIEFFFSYNIT